MKDDFRYLEIIATNFTETLFWFVTVIIEGVNIVIFEICRRHFNHRNLAEIKQILP